MAEGPLFLATPSQSEPPAPPALHTPASSSSALGPDSGLAFWGYVPWVLQGPRLMLAPCHPSAPHFAVPLPPWTATPLRVGWAHWLCSLLNPARCKARSRTESAME